LLIAMAEPNMQPLGALFLAPVTGVAVTLPPVFDTGRRSFWRHAEKLIAKTGPSSFSERPENVPADFLTAYVAGTTRERALHAAAGNATRI
jgi:hypothetical protein